MKLTLIAPCTGCDKLSVKFIGVVPEFPSITLAELMLTIALSSLLMVPVTAGVVIVAIGCAGLVNNTCRVSSASTISSLTTTTENVVEVTPGAKSTLKLVSEA